MEGKESLKGLAKELLWKLLERRELRLLWNQVQILRI
jgi:hypothetical protein